MQCTRRATRQRERPYSGGHGTRLRRRPLRSYGLHRQPDGRVPRRAGWARGGRWPGATGRSSLRWWTGSASIVPILIADSTDAASLRRVAERARVVASTVGPYVLHGEPLVAACAETGTDYVDLTGEAEFVDRMYLRYHATAERSGARLVHACGFDSIPHDLGAQFTVQQLPADRPITMRGYVTAGGTASGGTVRLGRHRHVTLPAGLVRTPSSVEATEGATAQRRVRLLRGRPGYDRSIGRWVLPLPTIDPQIVRSLGAALPEYGPDFSYGHFVALRIPLTAAAIDGRRRRRLRTGATAGDPRAAATPASAGHGSGRSAARPQLVPGTVSRHRGRPARRHRGRPAVTRATARPPRCSPSRRSASPTTICRRSLGRSPPRSPWATRFAGDLSAPG